MLWFWNKKKPVINAAAMRIYNIAAGMGDAISALEIARRYNLPLTVKECINLANAVDQYTAPKDKARQLYALIEPWSQALGGQPVPDTLVWEIVKCDRAIVPMVASTRGVDAALRVELIRQMLTKGTAHSGSLYRAYEKIPPVLMTEKMREECIRYALEMGDIHEAYQIANVGLWVRPRLPALLREELIKAVLQLEGSDKERQEYQRFAVMLA